MQESILSKLTNSWKNFVRPKTDNHAIETLTSYIKDTEHEELAVITALKAHLDLMQDNSVRNSQTLNRYAVLNRSILRLIIDIEALASVSQQAIAPQSKQKLLLEDLMKEIAVSTQNEFEAKQVSLSWNIKKGTTLIGDAIQLKHMFIEILSMILHRCKKLDHISITGQYESKCVSVTFRAGPFNSVPTAEFLPWRLGELHLIPTNGDGIGLATIDAMARLQHGKLSITGFRTERQVYKLILNS